MQIHQYLADRRARKVDPVGHRAALAGERIALPRERPEHHAPPFRDALGRAVHVHHDPAPLNIEKMIILPSLRAQYGELPLCRLLDPAAVHLQVFVRRSVGQIPEFSLHHCFISHTSIAQIHPDFQPFCPCCSTRQFCPYSPALPMTCQSPVCAISDRVQCFRLRASRSTQHKYPCFSSGFPNKMCARRRPSALDRYSGCFIRATATTSSAVHSTLMPVMPRISAAIPSMPCISQNVGCHAGHARCTGAANGDRCIPGLHHDRLLEDR